MQDLSVIRAAIESKDVEALAPALWALEQEPASVPLPMKLLLEEWHDLHEDIVLELGLLGDPQAILAIAEAIKISFTHLVEWHNLEAFQRKCAYALARIGTAESRSVLEDLSHYSDPQIRLYAQEGLAHWPMPYRR